MDLKLGNILVDSVGHMRLSDFGISQVLGNDQITIETGSKGKPAWMAAESIQTQRGKVMHGLRESTIFKLYIGMISFYVLTKGGQTCRFKGVDKYNSEKSWSLSKKQAICSRITTISFSATKHR